MFKLYVDSGNCIWFHWGTYASLAIAMAEMDLLHNIGYEFCSISDTVNHLTYS